MVFLYRWQSVSLNSIFIPLSPPIYPSLFHLLSLPSQHAVDRMYDIQMHCTVLEPAFCIQAELVSALLNNQWVSLQVSNTSLLGSNVCSNVLKFIEWKTLDEGSNLRIFVLLQIRICYWKKNYFSSLNSFLYFSKFQYKMNVYSLCWKQRCNVPCFPRWTYNFSLMHSNHAIQTSLRDGNPHKKSLVYKLLQ